MNSAFDRLQTASHKLAEVLYSQAGAAQGGETGQGEQASSASAGAEGDTGSTASSDENVIDAEYVDVEDEGKK
jgi:molecular chaperone DnaK